MASRRMSTRGHRRASASIQIVAVSPLIHLQSQRFSGRESLDRFQRLRDVVRG